MPVILSAAELMRRYDQGFQNIEEVIHSKFVAKRRKCTLDLKLQVTPDMSDIEFGRMTEGIVNGGYSTNPFVCTPVARVRTLGELDAYLDRAEEILIAELRHQHPKRLGSLHVACTVDPSRFCHAIVLAMPFARKE